MVSKDQANKVSQFDNKWDDCKLQLYYYDNLAIVGWLNHDNCNDHLIVTKWLKSLITNSELIQ